MSILPPPQKDGEIKFFLAKGLPYRYRMALVGSLLALGLGLQVTIGFWPGFALLVLAQLLGMNVGYAALPAGTDEGAWERVTPDEYEKVLRRAEELRSWDQDLFDGTNTSGVVGFAVMVLACVIAYNAAAAAWKFPAGYWVYFALDAAVLLVPLWFVGTREYLKKDKLVIKINMLKEVIAALTDPSDVHVQPMLLLTGAKGGGKAPDDARLMLKLVGAPKDLYGVQAQLSINSVQGKDYPYLYCVVIARHGSGLLDGYQQFERRGEQGLLAQLAGALFGGAGGFGTPQLVYEPQAAGEVDIIVVRQRTSRTSGYFTPPSAALSVVSGALDLARALVKNNGGAAV